MHKQDVDYVLDTHCIWWVFWVADRLQNYL